MMAYNTKELFNKALELAKDDDLKLLFIEDIIALLPCDKTTYYRHFPIDSNEYNRIRGELEKRKVNLKSKIRKEWENPNNFVGQTILYRLCATREERIKMSTTFIDDEIEDKEKSKKITVEHLFPSIDELKQNAKESDKS
jgi:hypothetical protein